MPHNKSRAPDGKKDAQQHEGKIATLSAINSALQAENEKLRAQLSSQQQQQQQHTTTTATSKTINNQKQNDDIAELTEEFSRRLAASERQTLIAQDERDALRAQLRAAAQGGSVTEAKLKEKDEYIEALNHEGEKLSKKNGELEVAARKARAQVRDVEGERDRLVAALAKAEARAMEAEESARALEEQMQAKEEEMKETLARQQNEQKRNESQEVSIKEQSQALAAALERETSYLQTIEDLRETIEQVSASAADREDALREEASRLEQRLRQLEVAAAVPSLRTSGSGSGSSGANQTEMHATTIIVDNLQRQLEVVTATATAQQTAAEEAENRLMTDLVALRKELRFATSEKGRAERKMQEQEGTIARLHTDIATLESTVRTLQSESEMHGHRCTEVEEELSRTRDKLTETAATLERHSEAAASERQRLQESMWEVEEMLRNEQLAKKKLLEEKLEAKENEQQQKEVNNITENKIAVVQQQQLVNKEDDEGDEMDVLVRGLYANNGTNNTTTQSMESSRISLLQHQLRLAERARDAANEQLVALLERIEEAQAGADRAVAMEARVAETTRKLDVALECIGERNERIESLEEDIRDMKTIFHEQLQEAADQLAAAKSQLSTLLLSPSSETSS